MSEIVDLAFQVSADSNLQADHRYHLFSAISTLVPDVHGGGAFAIHSLTGRQSTPGKLELARHSRLKVRCDASLIGALLSLSGATIRVGETNLFCGAPEVRKLLPAVTLRSSFVTIKRSDKKTDEPSFIEAARKQLLAIGVSENVEFELPARQSLKGEVRSAKRTFAIKGRQIIGYEIRLHGLTAEESLSIQKHGIGGRRAMGCGLFKPFRLSEVHPSKLPAEEKADA
jgi:CRISPR-associated protein Cas6